MTRPRQVLPGQFYLLTRRCTQRQFLLRPDEITNNNFVYCLVEAALRFEVELVMTTAESNHHHTVLYDRHGRCSQFVEHFHKMFARCQNARWGRWENLWSSGEPCITRLLDATTVIDKVVYTAANPVKDFLVERAVQWPGTNGYRHLIHRRPLRATRPAHFFQEGGTMPAVVETWLVIPAELGPSEQVIAEVQTRVVEIEQAVRAERARTGKPILGRRRVLRQKEHETPSSVEPRRTLRPRFAGPSHLRIPALIAFKDFLASYADARLRWLSGKHVVFPCGTYWLARFAPVTVDPSPT